MGDVVPLQKPDDYVRALKRIRKLWEESEVEFLPHAKKQMAKRGLQVSDARHVIRYGRVIEHSKPGEFWRYTIQGPLLDGGQARCVVEVNHHLIIVTFFVAGRRP